MKRLNAKKKLFLLITLLIIFLIINYGEEKIIDHTESEISKCSLNLIRAEDERDLAIESFILIHNQWSKNNSKLKQLKTGDNYNFHDPTYLEATDFIIASDYTMSGLPVKVIEKAMDKGIRCAYVTAHLKNGGREHLIGFDSIDEGVIYFAGVVYYEGGGIPLQAYLKIGSIYGECEPNSWRQGFGDEIVEIVSVWYPY